jgi:hypothetical protein
MLRPAALACVLVMCGSACGGKAAKPAASAPTQPTAAAATVAPEPTPAEAPAPVDPWPSTKDGAVWTVVAWEMNDHDADAALKTAGLSTSPRAEPKTGRVEAVDVTGATTGWKASVTFDKATGKVESIVVKGDSVTVEEAHAARARLEGRFGAPKETRVHSSRQWETKAIEIQGDRPSWRVTQSLMRAGDAKSNVEWPSLSSLSWGMPLAAGKAAMKAAGFVPEKVPKPPPPPPPPPPKGRAKKPAPPPKPAKGATPPGVPKGAKVVELTFKKSEEHVQLSVIDKTGLYKVAVGQDVTDRKVAERRASEASSGLGSASSEAETETTVWRDAKTDARLQITGFQGQRIVVETYSNPAQAPESAPAAPKK